MEKYVRIVDTVDYVRDVSTGAVVLVNKKPLDKYLQQKQKYIEEKNKIKVLEAEVSSLRNDVDTLTKAIRDLLDYKQNNCKSKQE